MRASRLLIIAFTATLLLSGCYEGARGPAGPAAPAPAERSARIDEVVVCSARGEVLYEWQCPSIGDRIGFMEFLSQRSAQLGEGLNLGDFDRLEMESVDLRILAQVRQDRGVFVRISKGAARRAAAGRAEAA